MNSKMTFAIAAGTLSAIMAAVAQAYVTPPVTVPEPATLSLLGLGLVGAAIARRRKNNQDK